MSFAPAAFASTSVSPPRNASMRTATVIESAVIPRAVAPPLFPDQLTHGGEYGSLGIWRARPAHGLAAPLAAAAPFGVVAPGPPEPGATIWPAAPAAGV